jgi:glyoxylase-like metal-dependent hydrolase (beta-lactamase superfamily II)
MRQSKDNKAIPMSSFAAGTGHQVCSDVYYYTNQIVNVIFIGDKHNWILVDTGMPKSAEAIISAAQKRFGKNSRPSAIVLTHGHFDHVGNVVKLVQEWKVPVYAHILEHPYLTGVKAYPEPDTSVEGGLLAKMSFIYPHEPINISEVLRPLPDDHHVPSVTGWEWIHTPGHCPGHVSLFRKSDGTLIAGDAFVTVQADSFYKVLVQKKEINGPPRYFTTDWVEAKKSVEKLSALNPEIAITGHGAAMEGHELRIGLRKLVNEFETLAVPEHGKFVKGRPL